MKIQDSLECAKCHNSPEVGSSRAGWISF